MKKLQKNVQLLESVLYPNPGRRETYKQDVEVVNHSAPVEQPLRVGATANFLYDFRIDRFLEVDESIRDIIGITREAFLSKSPAETLSSIVIPSHTEALVELMKKSFEILEVYAVENNQPGIIANIEHNIVSADGSAKRIISQYFPISHDDGGKPCINRGCVVDISHIKNDGLPQLFILENNRIIKTFVATPESVIKNGDIPLSKVEFRIIQLISEGLLAKEIADKADISISTLYTHRKNIKQKTGYDIHKLITVLKEKGLLMQAGAIQTLGEIVEISPTLML